MQTKTERSREWRAEQRKLGRVPKLIWLHPEDWREVKAVLDRVKRRRARK